MINERTGGFIRDSEGQITGTFSRLPAYKLLHTCPSCEGDGRDHGLQEPERSMNPCPTCEGEGMIA